MDTIFINQDYASIEIGFEPNTSMGIPGDVASAKIQVENPKGVRSYFDTNVEIDTTNSVVKHEFAKDEKLQLKGEEGIWQFRIEFTMTDDRTFPGTWFKYQISN